MTVDRVRANVKAYIAKCAKTVGDDPEATWQFETEKNGLRIVDAKEARRFCEYVAERGGPVIIADGGLAYDLMHEFDSIAQEFRAAIMRGAQKGEYLEDCTSWCWQVMRL